MILLGLIFSLVMLGDIFFYCLKFLNSEISSSVLLTSLRFGSMSYLAGDIRRAESVFTDACQLFERLTNPRGLAIAKNNLASVRMRQVCVFS